MKQFTYTIKQSVEYPESIKVKGKTIPAYADETRYFDCSPTISYSDDSKEGSDWEIKLTVLADGLFDGTVRFAGNVIRNDVFSPTGRGTSVADMIAKYTAMVEDWL